MNYNNDFEDSNMNSEGKNVYRATSNMNTALETPNVDIDSITGINIDNVYDGLDTDVMQNQNYGLNNSGDDSFQSNDIADNTINSDNNYNNNDFIPKEISGITNDSLVSNNELVVENKQNEKVVYEFTGEFKKKPNNGFDVWDELKVMLLIVGILLLIMFIFPYIIF